MPMASNRPLAAAVASAIFAPAVQASRFAEENVFAQLRARSVRRDGRSLTFVNSCPEPLVVVGSEPLIQLAPDERHVLDVGALPDKNFRWTPYFSAKGRDLCPSDGCESWSVTTPAQGSQWQGEENQHFAAVCNPFLSGKAGTVGCCSESAADYDSAAGTCPSIHDGGWGTLFEADFDAFADLDFINYSTNFLNTDRGPVFFNIPIAMTSTEPCANSHTKEVEMPWQCLSADCDTAYQSPEDSEGNGAQLSCSNAASYTIEYCPGGRMPFSDGTEVTAASETAPPSGGASASPAEAWPGMPLNSPCR